jgi:hypothetical protein
MSLTNEDKAWLSETFGARIERVETSLLAQIQTLDAKIERVETRLLAQIQTLDVKIERVETSLLTEFHKWASPMEMRVHSHTATLRAIDLEQEYLAQRIQKLERPSA